MAKPSAVDVSVNITCHGEGILLHKTLRSIRAGIRYATDRGVKVECNVSLDNPTAETKRVMDHFLTEYKDFTAKLYELSEGDISGSRNYLINKSSGTYIAFFDGDDFFTENYIYDAFVFAEQHDEPAIYSPRYLLVFEGDHYLVEKLDSDGYPAIMKNMFETNYFIGQSFAHRAVYDELRYQPDGKGYGMEDWQFSCEAAAHGYKFYNVPNTIFFYRRKRSGSLLSSHVGTSSVIHPTKLFRPEVFIELARSDAPATKAKPRGIKARLKQYELTAHYVAVQITVHKNIAKALKRRHLPNLVIRRPKSRPLPQLTGVPQRLLDIGFTPELVELWGKVNQYEPMIRSSIDMQLMMPIVGYPQESQISDLYLEFCKQNVGHDIRDIVMVPHIIKGGADLAAINLITELSKHKAPGKVLVVATVDTPSPWMDRVRNLDNVICIEKKSLDHRIDDDRLMLFILRIIQHMGTKRLSIINSEVGYKLVTRYHQAIRDVGCRTYLHTYAFNMTADGFLFNVLMNGLVDAYKGVDMYVTDTEAYAKQLQEINGFAADKTATLYLPAQKPEIPKTDYAVKRKVLWASRINDDKLVEVMVEVGKLLAPHKIGLDVFGVIDDEYKGGRFNKMIAGHPSIHYKGPFDGYKSLPINNYDMFLLTTKNEGMPLVILEACATGLFSVAPAVGGIGETIEDGVNGNIVADKFSPQSYVDAILRAYETEAFTKQDIMARRNVAVLERHSDEAYSKAVTQLLDL